jgi:Uma2 family endonuclease
MTALATRRLSIDEFLALPEEKPYREFLRGAVIEKPMPTELHSLVAGEIFGELRTHLRASKEGRAGFEARHAARTLDWVFLPDVHVRLYRGGPLPVSERGAIEGAPDFAIEVLSPDDRVSRWLERVALYMAAGTQLLWVIDPIEERIHVYRPGEPPRTYSGNATLDCEPVLPGLTLDFAAIFANAKLTAPE